MDREPSYVGARSEGRPRENREHARAKKQIDALRAHGESNQALLRKIERLTF